MEALVTNSIYKDSITQDELAYLQNLLSSVRTYQEETSAKFKDYTLKVSRNQKMHQNIQTIKKVNFCWIFHIFHFLDQSRSPKF